MEPPSTASIHISNPSFEGVSTDRIRDAVAQTLALFGKARENRREIEVLLVSDEGIRELNLTWRSLDEATDVLSFPAPDFHGSPLGEIAISVNTAERQARARGIELADELCYLAIHGALHLVGFDDETEGDRDKMFGAMHEAGIALGLPEQSSWTSLPHEPSEAPR